MTAELSCLPLKRLFSITLSVVRFSRLPPHAISFRECKGKGVAGVFKFPLIQNLVLYFKIIGCRYDYLTLSLRLSYAVIRLRMHFLPSIPRKRTKCKTKLINSPPIIFQNILQSINILISYH